MSIVYHLKSNAQKILLWLWFCLFLGIENFHYIFWSAILKKASKYLKYRPLCLEDKQYIKFNNRDQFLKTIMDEILNILVKQTPSWKMAAIYDFWVDHVLFVFNYIWTTNVQSLILASQTERFSYIQTYCKYQSFLI